MNCFIKFVFEKLFIVAITKETTLIARQQDAADSRCRSVTLRVMPDTPHSNVWILTRGRLGTTIFSIP
jgi:hypothetical protein